MSKKSKNRGENRIKDLHIRFTEEEIIQLQELADDFEMSVSEFVRWSVFQRKVVMRILVDDNHSAFSKIIYKLDRIGNNINQIAKVLSTGFVDPGMFKEELEAMFSDIHSEIGLLNDAQAAVDDHWKKKIQKYSKLYQVDKAVRLIKPTIMANKNNLYLQ